MCAWGRESGRKRPEQHKPTQTPVCVCELLARWGPSWLFPSNEIVGGKQRGAVGQSACCPLSSVGALVKGLVKLRRCEWDCWGCWGGGEEGSIAFVQALCLAGEAHRGVSL